MLSSTLDPPLGLNRLRLSAQLREFRADRLRFTMAESATLLASAGLSLTSSQVEGAAPTNGRVGDRAAPGRARFADEPDPDRLVAEFSGDERSVADHLTGEIMNCLDPNTLALLRAHQHR